MERREPEGGVRETPLVVVLPSGGPATPQILAHELQSPVKAVRLLAESVRNAAGRISTDQLDRCMDSILRSTMYMAELIGRMTGGAGLTVRTTDLHRLVRETVEDLGAILGGRAVRLSLRPVDEVPADPTAIKEVLVNLLSNAARYSRSGSAISVRLAPAPGGVSLTVTDRCGGIPVAVRSRIFEPFVRGGGTEGTGLGLAISRGFVEANGGRIVLQSGSGDRRTSFAVSLPLVAQPAPAA
jgi:signal transduction histidine kinase